MILTKMSDKELKISQMPVAHTCNPGYLGGCDQEDQGSRPAPAKKFVRLISMDKNWVVCHAPVIPAVAKP
jgi:hypothetical protein